MSDLVDDLKTYCQKSTMFLYPMLGLPANIKPISTYLLIEDVEFKAPCLIALFSNKSVNYLNLKNQINSNKYFEYKITDDVYDYYIFNCEPFKEEYLKIINGKYSKLSKLSKVKIVSNSANNLTQIALYPERYYNLYEEELEINLDGEEGPELLDLPDFKVNEIIHVSDKIKNTLKQLQL
jgi:hypothetical protein